MNNDEMMKRAHEVAPKEFDDLVEVYHSTDMDQKEFMAHVRLIAERHKGDGYCPHEGMGYFTCPNCGCGEWISYPQAVPTDGRKWTYEYNCARCGKMMGLTLKGDEE